MHAPFTGALVLAFIERASYLELRPKPPIQEKHGKTRAEAILKKLNAQASIGIAAGGGGEGTKENRTRFSENTDNNTVENSRLVSKSAVPGYDSDSSDDYRPSGGAQIAPPTFLQEKGPELRPGSSGTLATARKAKKIGKGLKTQQLKKTLFFYKNRFLESCFF